MVKEKISSALKGINGTVIIPGDKSVSHRSVLFASIAEGTSVIRGFLKGQDCLSTISCMKQMGVEIEETNDTITVHGKGFAGLKEPERVLDVGNSGTTIRLLSGLLSGTAFYSVLEGDDSIAKRPMSRVTVPLRQMGAKIEGRENGNLTPLSIRGSKLTGIEYDSPVASAQVKSAVLLAGLNAKGTTRVKEPSVSRDHTERMLSAFGVDVYQDQINGIAEVTGGSVLKARNVQIPGDISSAAFFLAAAAITPHSALELKNVGVNPTRTGILDVLEQMGADITVFNERTETGEPVADIRVCCSELKGTEVGGALIPRLIDEIPAIAVIATQAEGTTIIKDAAELKVKETNRIDTMVNQLKKLGADIEATDDGMIIHGKTPLIGGEVSSYHDHRVGMSLALCGLIAKEEVVVHDAQAVDVSYPGFFEELNRLK
ncbi:3-phosphoshikimate 1-carboxyvinyltransferase [Alteribacter keqinensis]|uniref:3-phosphoshikimate 1-carboxyvinyltransferase n=1 Tax=Alteribacter keqinensis TaxID=2483800 RepID=A0A3M7TWK6_9BACI|nr:3-phosphoshikimate 1-carboxyvinyltransferase [Alteribacter keqinensis]RNA69154.1 3-phosphoshikimate 1-carboxyvinyltransferase [Alteribacter keqinensis]